MLKIAQFLHNCFTLFRYSRFKKEGNMRTKSIEIPSVTLDGYRLISRVVYNNTGGYVEGVIVKHGVETRLTHAEYKTHDQLDTVLSYLTE